LTATNLAFKKVAGGLWKTDERHANCLINSPNSVSLTAGISSAIGGFSAKTTAYNNQPNILNPSIPLQPEDR
jgi:hypothetical protein